MKKCIKRIISLLLTVVMMISVASALTACGGDEGGKKGDVEATFPLKEEVTFKYYIYLVAKSKALNHLNVEKRRKEIVEEYFNNDEVILLQDNEINVLDLVSADKLIITEQAVKNIEEVLK